MHEIERLRRKQSDADEEAYMNDGSRARRNKMREQQSQLVSRIDQRQAQLQHLVDEKSANAVAALALSERQPSISREMAAATAASVHAAAMRREANAPDPMDIYLEAGAEPAASPPTERMPASPRYGSTRLHRRAL